ncbi:MAG: hypothetical protein ACHQ2Y_07505 [Candidatus Lutacidiplasmatales archaeon]
MRFNICGQASPGTPHVFGWAEAGFSVHFKVASSGPHFIKVFWTLNESGNRSPIGYLVILNASNPNNIVGQIATSGHYLRNGTHVLDWNGTLSANQAYIAETYFNGSVSTAHCHGNAARLWVCTPVTVDIVGWLKQVKIR